MNHLKAIYPTVFLTAEAIALWRALVHLTGEGGPSGAGRAAAGWWAVAVISGAFLGFFCILMLRLLPRTSSNLPAQLAIGVLGAVLAVAAWVLDPTSLGASEAAAWAVGLGLVVQPLYVFWYSRIPQPSAGTLLVGAPLPEFGLVRPDGSPARSSDHIGTPTVWMFFRGSWCPLCMAQIKEVAGLYQQIEARGARVALVSPSPQGDTQRLARRHGVAFDYYRDPGLRAAQRLGIVHERGLPTGLQALGYESDTVLPTVVVTDAAGLVRAVHRTDNYRVRPEPETFLADLPPVG